MGKGSSKEVNEDVLVEPWREAPKFENKTKKNLKDKLQNFGLYDKEMSHYNILLLGMVGHGKTSFVNTVESALTDRVSCRQPVGNVASMDVSSVTQKFQVHKFTEEKDGDEIVKFRVCDTMGVESNKAFKLDDLKWILDGHMLNGYIFDLEQPMQNNSVRFKRNPDMSDKMHIVAICVAADVISGIEGEALTKVKKYLKVIQKRGIPFCVLLTKVDLIFDNIMKKDKAHLVYNSQVVRDAVDTCAAIYGVPPNQVYPVKNYHNETESTVHIDVMALHTTLKLMDHADASFKMNSTE